MAAPPRTGPSLRTLSSDAGPDRIPSRTLGFAPVTPRQRVRAMVAQTGMKTPMHGGGAGSLCGPRYPSTRAHSPLAGYRIGAASPLAGVRTDPHQRRPHALQHRTPAPVVCRTPADPVSLGERRQPGHSTRGRPWISPRVLRLPGAGISGSRTTRGGSTGRMRRCRPQLFTRSLAAAVISSSKAERTSGRSSHSLAVYTKGSSCGKSSSEARRARSQICFAPT